MTYIKPITPGEILLEEFMEPNNLSKADLSKAIGVAQNRIGKICNGTRSISTDTAFRLSKFFETSIEFWTNLQSNYDIEVQKQSKTYNNIKTLSQLKEEYKNLNILYSTLTYKKVENKPSCKKIESTFNMQPYTASNSIPKYFG